MGTFSNLSFETDLGRTTGVGDVVVRRIRNRRGPGADDRHRRAVSGGALVDLTPERCSVILAGTSRGLGNLSQDLWQIEANRRAASRAETGPPSLEVETTRGSATSVALQMLYCGREAEARDVIRQVWPDAQQEAVRTALAAAAAAAAARRR